MLQLQPGGKMEKASYRRRKGQRKSYKSFIECLKFVQKQQLHTVADWKEYCRSGKKPDTIPSHPNLVFKDRGWVDWAEWLGTRMYTYEQAKEVVAKMDIMNGVVWKEQAGKLFPRPSRMPLMPDKAYGKDWEGWTKFLGHDEIKTRHPGPPTPPTLPYNAPTYRPFEEAMKMVAKLGLKSNVEYAQWRGKYPHTDLPYRPDEVYRDDWIGWGAFLGNKFLPALLTDTTVMYIGRRPTDPGNVYIIAKEELGKSELMHRAEREGFKVLRVWKYDPTLRDEVEKVLQMNATEYGPDPDYIVGNIFGLYGDMMNVLMVV